MSRSGYSDDCDGWQLIMYRGAVAAATRGKRGQQLLRELLAALDAMPDKRLVADELVDADGEMCALGVLGKARGIDMSKLDPEWTGQIAKAFNIAPALAREIVYENDEVCDGRKLVRFELCGPLRHRWESHVRHDYIDDPKAAETRWAHMRAWVAAQIKEQS